MHVETNKIHPCLECGGIPIFTLGNHLHPFKPQWHHRHGWRCNCGAYVGAHERTREPLGSPAGPPTRRARRAAHLAFDGLWKRWAQKSGSPAKVIRNAAYQWLAARMGMTEQQCHIGLFDQEQCETVIKICDAN